jgi:2'-5' RNA ligase
MHTENKVMEQMDLEEHYNKLYRASIDKIQSGSYLVDELIDSSSDNRRGITVLLRPDDVVKDNIQKFLAKIKTIEPNQYFYRNSDLHVTVMSIITCYNEFNLHQIRIEDYIKTIRKAITGLNRFNIEFRGLTASPSCLMVQGFTNNNTLNQIRDNLRFDFKRSSLEHSIDKRYTIQTAHSTIFRLKEKLRNKADFLKIVEAYRNCCFGTFEVNTIELVFNDWYQRKEYVETLCQFKLK